MEISFAGKRALVTGAGSGIGKEVALTLARCHAKVIAVDINSEALSLLSKEMPTHIQPITLDLSKWSSIDKLNFLEIGQVELLVNCAGVIFEEEITDITEENVERQMDVNIKAIIYLTRKLAADLIQRGVPGAIVNISSQASMAGLVRQSVYCATKGAVDAFTRASALELGPFGIRVNSVNPTIIMTDLGRQVWSDPAKAEPMLAKIPLGRFGSVEDVARAVAFLLSDKASLINGVCLAVDGGFLAN